MITWFKARFEGGLKHALKVSQSNIILCHRYHTLEWFDAKFEGKFV